MSYGNDVLMPHLRNNGTLTLPNEDGTNVTYPLQFSANETITVKTFAECFEILDRKKKYTRLVRAEKESFYDGGGYAFLSKMEEEFKECASICKAPIFFLT